MSVFPSLSKVFSTLLNIAHKKAPNATGLEQLEGKSFVIAIDELPQDIGVVVEKNQIIPLDETAIAHADVTISGGLKAVINMIKNESGDIDDDELFISGKMSTAKNFQHFLASLSVDWQLFFEQLLPAGVAKKTAHAVERGMHFAKDSKAELEKQITAYLVEKKRCLVTKAEFEQHKKNLQQLRASLDKVDALL